MDKSAQRVNAAVALCVRRHMESVGDVEDRNAYAVGVGKRVRGTYGAELRRFADLHPDACPEELFDTVLVPAEFPHEGASVARRARHYGPFIDFEDPDLTAAEDVGALIAAVKAGDADAIERLTANAEKSAHARTKAS